MIYSILGLKWPRYPRTAGSVNGVAAARTAAARRQVPVSLAGGMLTIQSVTAVINKEIRYFHYIFILHPYF